MSVCAMTRLVWLLAACAAASALDARESRTVQTAQGPVRGYKSDDGLLFQFFGVPYATAPTGDRRFTAPLPGPSWTEPFEAVEKDIICPQLDSFFTQELKVQENCLIATIHVPDTDETNLPVLVYVHGGGYMTGFGELASPSNLAKTKKLIGITFNYRLSVHGFLCLGTESAPGNAGLKDQVALLRWVRMNIANFGGNPDDVTIAGGSAGSTSVDLLMLSDVAEGLFNKAIPESGASLSSWTMQIEPLKAAKEYAEFKGFKNTEDLSALEEYYKSASYEELISGDFPLKDDGSFYFTPCVERDIGQEMILKDSPINILKKGDYRKIPVLYGICDKEGLSLVPYFEIRKDSMNERFADFLPPDLQFSSEKEKNDVAEAVKEFYFGNNTVNEDTVEGYIDYCTDVNYSNGHLRSVKLQVEAGSDSIYLYEYSFYAQRPAGLYPDYVDKVEGADHCAQSMAVYDNVISHFYIDGESEEYKKMRSILQEMWINFITTGKPIPDGSEYPAWPPVGANGSPYMGLGHEIQLVQQPLLNRRARFWSDIYDRFWRSPEPPPHNSSSSIFKSYALIGGVISILPYLNLTQNHY